MTKARLAEDTDGAADAKEDGVEVLLRDVVVLQDDARVRVDVRPRVLHLHVSDNAAFMAVHVLPSAQISISGMRRALCRALCSQDVHAPYFWNAR